MTNNPLYCDNNAFEYLSEKDRYDAFIGQLGKSPNLQAQGLLNTFNEKEFIKHPIAFVELFWLPQKAIHQRLEKIIPSLYPEAKKAIAPFLKDFKRSSKTLKESRKLGKGLDATIDILYNGFFKHLWNVESDLSLKNLLGQIENRRQQLSNPSPLFLNKYEFIKANLNDVFRKELIHDLSLEAIYRYGGYLISKLYTGDHELDRRWFDHLSALYFGLWEENKNYSAYRIIGEELELLNRKYKLNFFPAQKLRPHDDTVDGYVVHALSFGWFYPLKGLSPISALSEDPFEEVFARVQQYQIYLSYAQNPLNNPVNAPARILHAVLPGTLYSFDRKASSLQIVTFQQAKVLEGDPDPKIQHAHSEIEIIFL